MNTVQGENAVISQTTGFGVSDKFKVVNTLDLVKALESHGYQVNSVQAQNTRKQEKQGFQRHFVRLSKPEYGTWNINGDEVRPELTIINAYDGTTALRVGLGAFRFVCLNGLILGEAFGYERLPHVGDILQQIPGVLECMVKRFESMNERMHAYSERILTLEEQSEFAQLVANNLVGHRDDVIGKRYEMLLQRRRPADQGNTLWQVLNVIQENAMKGNLEVVSMNANTRDLSRRKVRAIKAIDRSIKVNQFVWNTADRFLNAA